MDGGQAGDTEVDLAAGDGEGDAAILRHAALGDIEVGEDLDTRDDGERHAERRRVHLVERAVHAVADLEVLLEGLDVNIGGAVGDGLVEDEVDEADDGGGGGGALDALLVGGVGVKLGELFDERVGGVAAGEALVDGGLDLRLGGEDEADFAGEEEGELVDDVGLNEVRGGEGDVVALGLDGHDGVHPHAGHGDEVLQRVVKGELGEVDDVGALAAGHEGEEVVLAKDVQVEDEFLVRLAAFDVLADKLLGLGIVDEAVLEDERDEGRELEGVCLFPSE